MVLVGDIVKLVAGEVDDLSVTYENGLGGYAFKNGAIPKDLYNFEVIKLIIPRAERIKMVLSKDDMNEVYRIMRSK